MLSVNRLVFVLLHESKRFSILEIYQQQCETAFEYTRALAETWLKELLGVRQSDIVLYLCLIVGGKAMFAWFYVLQCLELIN